MKICPACSREWEDEHGVCPEDGVALVQLDRHASGKAEALVGKLVGGRYRIERVVGKGGMGVVYACRHAVVGRPLAIKVLRSNVERSEEILQRFIREAQAANAIRSRHICEMTDFGQLDSGAFYVVMELLDGASLTRTLKRGKLSRDDLLHIFIQVAETLDKAHAAGILHRDLKPDNVVIVEDDDDPLFVKLVDFGIAKMMRGGSGDLTETGVVLGTPFYMSPEQARGEDLDQRTDIYSLGVMMYRAFTGNVPFVANTAMGVLTRHITDPPEPPSRVAEVDGPVERLILRCMEKKPIDRFQSMLDVAEALRSVRAQCADDDDPGATFDEGTPLRNEPDVRATRDERSSRREARQPTAELKATRDERSLRRRPPSATADAAPAATGGPSAPPGPARSGALPGHREDTPTRVRPLSIPPAAPAPSTPPPGARMEAAATSRSHESAPPPPATAPSASVAPSIPPPIPPPTSPSEPLSALPFPASEPNDPLLGEAATDRGLVAPRDAPRRTPTWPWFLLAALATAGTVAVSALVFHEAPPPPSSGAPAAPPTAPALPHSDDDALHAAPGDEDDEDDDRDEEGHDHREATDEAPAPSSPSAQPTTASPPAAAPPSPRPAPSTQAPPSTSPPPPPSDYDDGVRSPFE